MQFTLLQPLASRSLWPLRVTELQAHVHFGRCYAGQQLADSDGTDSAAVPADHVQGVASIPVNIKSERSNSTKRASSFVI
jgi:hypothetical protein